MSTPPTPAPPSKPIPLAPIVAILIVVIIVAFGICATNFKLEGDSPPIVSVAIAVEFIAFLGLIALAVIGITRRRNSQ
jgi:hypothetical protein